MAFLVARVSAQDPCVHPFKKWPLRASVFMSLKTKIGIRTFVFTTGILQQRMALTADTVRVQVAWGMVPVGCIPLHRQGLDSRTLWLLWKSGSKNQSLGCSDPNVDFHWLWKRMHGRVVSETDARKGFFGHPERPFWRMRATDFWATNARKVWGKSRMHAAYVPDGHKTSNRRSRQSTLWRERFRL